MSHRKFHAPRHGSTGFLPRKRCTHIRGQLRSFPVDDQSKPCHLTAFMGYKAGMTHVIRTLDLPRSNAHQKDICEAVTIIDCPAMVAVGLVGYIETPKGLRALTTVWANHISDECRRRFYKNWYRAKKSAFCRYAAKYADGAKSIQDELARMKKYCSVVRLIAHTQPSKLPIAMRKAHILEIQINGGEVSNKVDFGYGLFEKEIRVGDVFSQDGCLDHAAITKGHGYEGTVHRFGVGILTRKTHRGSRRVACIGPWHPSNVSYTVARTGQRGYHQRTELNKKILRIANGADATSGCGRGDITEKTINPMGGFMRYGEVKNDFIMVRGGVTGCAKRPITLRLPVKPQATAYATENITLKYIDTTSKMGHGRFATSVAKKAFYRRN